MRLFKIVLYVLLVVVLQTVIFARLSLRGVSPDLILVSIVGFAVVEKKPRAVLFSAGAGFLQDILSFGIYMHLISRVAVSVLISNIKESFAGNEYALVAGLVAVTTPLVLIFEGGFYSLFWGRSFEIGYWGATILIATIYNLVMVPVLFPIVKRVCHA